MIAYKKSFFRSLCLLGVLQALAFLPAHADSGDDSRYSDHYIGFTTDVDFRADAEKPVKDFFSLQYIGIGGSYGYGRGLLRPRVRLNFGWIPEAGVTSSVGIELPLFETLSPARSKLFGIYIAADGGLAIGAGLVPYARVSPFVRIPIGNIEGVGIGASWSTRNEWSVFICRNSGVYPLRSVNNQQGSELVGKK